jgi:hypothetical protein
MMMDPVLTFFVIALGLSGVVSPLASICDSKDGVRFVFFYLSLSRVLKHIYGSLILRVDFAPVQVL